MNPAAFEPQNADTEYCRYLHCTDNGISFPQCQCACVKRQHVKSPSQALSDGSQATSLFLKYPPQASSDGSDNPQMPEVLGDETHCPVQSTQHSNPPQGTQWH